MKKADVLLADFKFQFCFNAFRIPLIPVTIAYKEIPPTRQNRTTNTVSILYPPKLNCRIYHLFHFNDTTFIIKSQIFSKLLTYNKK